MRLSKTASNKTMFSTVEFDLWADREGLIFEERYLIETYLSKTGKTLEAGTGGGRILLEMKNMDFTSLYGFDFIPEFIKHAKGRDIDRVIHFTVQDAVALGYDDCAFDQIIYLQQVVCFTEDERARLRALQEAYRVLRPGGIGLFSFLCFDVRSRSCLYLPYLLYLRAFRRLVGSNLSIQYLPHLKLGGNFNYRSLVDQGPFTYWYKIEEIHRLLESVGFDIIALGTYRQIKDGRMCQSCEALLKERLEGMLYCVCKK